MKHEDDVNSGNINFKLSYDIINLRVHSCLANKINKTIHLDCSG